MNTDQIIEAAQDKGSPTTHALFASLVKTLDSRNADIEFYTVPRYIGCRVMTNKSRVATFNLFEEHIYIWLHLKPGELDGRQSIASRHEKHYSVRLAREEDIETAVDLIIESYERNKQPTPRFPRKRMATDETEAPRTIYDAALLR